LQKPSEFRENTKLIVLLRLSIQPAIPPKTCKNFQKEEMISIKVVFFSINPGVISRKVGVFRERWSLQGSFRDAGEIFQKLQSIQKKNSSQKNDLYAKSLVVYGHPQDYIITRVDAKKRSFLKKRRSFESTGHI
jgi:hypothetical protein